MFVPLVHPPGHAQADFGEAIGIIGASSARSTSSLLTCRIPEEFMTLRRLLEARMGKHSGILCVRP